MLLEIMLLILPIYAGIFVIFYRFRHVIKVMSDANDIFSDLISDTPEIDKREFLIEKLRSGEQISNSKTQHVALWPLKTHWKN